MQFCLECQHRRVEVIQLKQDFCWKAISQETLNVSHHFSSGWPQPPASGLCPWESCSSPFPSRTSSSTALPSAPGWRRRCSWWSWHCDRDRQRQETKGRNVNKSSKGLMKRVMISVCVWGVNILLFVHRNKCGRMWKSCKHILVFLLCVAVKMFEKALFPSKDAVTQMYLPLSKHQSWLGLCVIVAGWRATDEHGGATVPAEGVLQDAGHFAVTVRHVTFLQERYREKGRREEKRIIKEEEREREKRSRDNLEPKECKKCLRAWFCLSTVIQQQTIFSRNAHSSGFLDSNKSQNCCQKFQIDCAASY